MRAKPKKSLGQNFLVDKNIQRKIISAVSFRHGDSVLEIGSGRGEITRLIAKDVSRVYALELDHNLFKDLEDSLKDCTNVTPINKDILKFDLDKYFAKSENKIKVFGNIPYYISSPIIEHLLIFRNKIETVFLTVQKEFGRRIVSGPGSKEYSSFSCFVQYYTEPRIIFDIKKNSFYPAPKVDSCFLKLDIRRHGAVEIGDEDSYFRIIRAAFNKRRKTLRNSLKGMIEEEKLKLFFEKFKINPDVRPEKLTLSDFANLTNL